jgi:hypothetical protein
MLVALSEDICSQVFAIEGAIGSLRAFGLRPWEFRRVTYPPARSGVSSNERRSSSIDS